MSIKMKNKNYHSVSIRLSKWNWGNNENQLQETRFF